MDAVTKAGAGVTAAAPTAATPLSLACVVAWLFIKLRPDKIKEKASKCCRRELEFEPAAAVAG